MDLQETSIERVQRLDARYKCSWAELVALREHYADLNRRYKETGFLDVRLMWEAPDLAGVYARCRDEAEEVVAAAEIANAERRDAGDNPPFLIERPEAP